MALLKVNTIAYIVYMCTCVFQHITSDISSSRAVIGLMHPNRRARPLPETSVCQICISYRVIQAYTPTYVKPRESSTAISLQMFRVCTYSFFGKKLEFRCARNFKALACKPTKLHDVVARTR